MRHLKPRCTVKSSGHEVFQHADHAHIFVLVLDGSHRIHFVLNEPQNTCQIQGNRFGNIHLLHSVENLPQLEQAVASQASSLAGMQWPCRPTSGRLSAATPSTNYRTI